MWKLFDALLINYDVLVDLNLNLRDYLASSSGDVSQTPVWVGTRRYPQVRLKLFLSKQKMHLQQNEKVYCSVNKFKRISGFSWDMNDCLE